MVKFLSDNLGTVIISAVLLFILAMIVLKFIKDKKKGKTSCGCECFQCPSSSVCHKK